MSQFASFYIKWYRRLQIATFYICFKAKWSPLRITARSKPVYMPRRTVRTSCCIVTAVSDRFHPIPDMYVPIFCFPQWIGDKVLCQWHFPYWPTRCWNFGTTAKEAQTSSTYHIYVLYVLCGVSWTRRWWEVAVCIFATLCRNWRPFDIKRQWRKRSRRKETPSNAIDISYLRAVCFVWWELDQKGMGCGTGVCCRKNRARYQTSVFLVDRRCRAFFASWHKLKRIDYLIARRWKWLEGFDWLLVRRIRSHLLVHCCSTLKLTTAFLFDRSCRAFLAWWLKRKRIGYIMTRRWKWPELSIVF